MRIAFYITGGIFIVAAAYWSYSVSYETQAHKAEVSRLKTEIAKEKKSIRVLRAQWAWQNAPDNLLALLALQEDRLKLEPIKPARFAELWEAPMVPPDDGMSPQPIEGEPALLAAKPPAVATVSAPARAAPRAEKPRAQAAARPQKPRAQPAAPRRVQQPAPAAPVVYTPPVRRAPVVRAAPAAQTQKPERKDPFRRMFKAIDR